LNRIGKEPGKVKQETLSSETRRQATMDRMYRSDMALVGIFFAAMWVVLLYVLFQVHGIAPDRATRWIATATALLVGVFASGALLAVGIHLRKSKEALYSEDCRNAGL
jgi:hypothetical protein